MSKNDLICRKCNDTHITEHVTLCGMYHTRLCLDCHNQFHVALLAQPLYYEVASNAAFTDLLLATCTGRIEEYHTMRTELLNLVHEKHVLFDRLFEFARDWVGTARQPPTEQPLPTKRCPRCKQPYNNIERGSCIVEMKSGMRSEVCGVCGEEIEEQQVGVMIALERSIDHGKD